MDKGTTSGCGWAANGEVFLREEKEGRCGELCGEFKGELRGESGGMNAAEPVSLEEDIAGEGEMCNLQQQIQAEKEDQCGVRVPVVVLGFSFRIKKKRAMALIQDTINI